MSTARSARRFKRRLVRISREIARLQAERAALTARATSTTGRLRSGALTDLRFVRLAIDGLASEARTVGRQLPPERRPVDLDDPYAEAA